jgi:hypothetical protein
LRIVLAAQADRAKLPPQEYRWVWGIWQVFRWHRIADADAPAPPPAA